MAGLDPAIHADREAALALTPVSRETLARLDRFVAALLERQQHVNLIAPSTIPHLWTRHVADSLQLLALAPDARVWADLGSGGGFPGLVIACALADRPGAKVHLIESIGKKATFLREAAAAAGVPAIVHQARIEHFASHPPERIEVVMARAVAPLTKLLALTEPLLKTGAQGLFHKGQDVEAELTEAAKSWNIKAMLVPSLTDSRARIVRVSRADRRRAGR
jgi:16S rRNA (guanine527-N7)-methyltransferase